MPEPATNQPEQQVLPLAPDLAAPELEALANHPDARVRAAVAAHANTPASSLAVLAAQFPGEVLGNPALPLLRLAHPRWLHGWPRSSLLAAVQHPGAPDWLRRFVFASPHTELVVALASHPALTAPEVDQLARHAAWLVRARVAARPGLDAPALYRLAQDPDYGVRLAVASRADLPDECADLLRVDPSRFVRQVVAQRSP